MQDGSQIVWSPLILLKSENKNAHISSVLNVFIVRSPFGLAILVHV